MDLNEISVDKPPNINMSQDLLNMRDIEILEEGPQVPQGLSHFPALEEGSQVSQDLNMRDLRIVEEGPRVCPVCSQEIRLYFINYNDKIEMCENLECDYPFGYEPLKIVREENGIQTVEIKSMAGKGTRSVAGSQTSSQGWSEVDRVCHVFESEDVPNVQFNKLKQVPPLKKTDADRRREELLQNVEKIKQMTRSMSSNKETKRIIRNEKWIKNLQYLQGLSGFNLLRPAEMKKIKEKEGLPGTSDLKIDIDKNNLANITIQVNRAGASDAKTV